ncbi:MAG: MYG1 family protein [Parachlamydiaceae bacterium]|nr:MYG1 family protein [Parachlamydiaceae bacterium]
MKEKIPRSCGTHDGTFHADEVTACALLLLFNLIDQDKIFRTRDLAQLSQCEYVCDVGGVYDPSSKLFDHHQVDYQGPMSSAGMILKYLENQKYLKPREYSFLNHSLIMGVDAHDNGKDPLIPGYCSFSHVVSNFTPIHYDCTEQEQNAAFHLALNFVFEHLKRLWERFQYTHSCREIVEKCMKEHQNCLIFDKNLPWLEIFFELNGKNHPALFVIMPSGSHWKLRGIPPSYEDRMKVRIPLPKNWAGLLEDDLKKASQIPGAIFCHKGRFISVWETKEDAMKALEYTLKYTEENESDNRFWQDYQRRIAG